VSRTWDALQVGEAALTTQVRLPRLVPGTVVVAFLIGLGRWGSYLGLPRKQLFVTDLLLAVTTVYTVVRYRQALAGHLRGVGRSRLVALLPLLALPGWALLRGLPGLTSANGLRDLAPYAYLGILAMLALIPRDPAAGRDTVRVLIGALVVHAAWVSVAQLWPWPDQLARLPLLGGMVRVLEIRVDYDGAMLAVLAGLALYAVSRVQRPAAVAGLLVACAWCSLLVLTLASRAALIALTLSLAVGGLRSFALLGRLWRDQRRLMVGGLVVLVAALAVGVPQTPTYQRLTGAPGFTAPGGTTTARELAWSAVVDYTGRTAARTVSGVGMGPDFLKLSGASVHYQDPTGPPVRQPHNFAINTYARLGLIGVALLLVLYVTLARDAVRALLRSARRSDREPALELTLVLLCGVLFVTSMLGVITESPFGAIPFGWAAGLLLVRARVTAAP